MAKEDKVKTPKSKKTKHATVKEAEGEGGKSKGAVVKEAEVEAVSYEDRMAAVTSISKPMADKKKVMALCKSVVIF